MKSTKAVVEIVFRVLEPEATGRSWLTCQAHPLAEEVTIGYVEPLGDAYAAHGSEEGWPRLAICADPTRALCALIGAWGDQVASSADDEEEEGLNS